MLKSTGFAGTDIELRTRRLTWWQAMARAPQRHAQCLAALFGKCKLEEHEAQIDGHLTGWDTPWARQLLNDLEI